MEEISFGEKEGSKEGRIGFFRLAAAATRISSRALGCFFLAASETKGIFGASFPRESVTPPVAVIVHIAGPPPIAVTVHITAPAKYIMSLPFFIFFLLCLLPAARTPIRFPSKP